MNDDKIARAARPKELNGHWLSLNEAVAYLISRGLREGQAKVAICDALAEKRVRLRAHRGGGDGRPAKSLIYEINDVDITSKLNPHRFDWPNSRTAPLYPWRIRSGQPNARWEYRNIALIQLKLADLAVELCNDLSSVRLPEPNSTAKSRSVDSVRDLQEIAQSKWSPSPATVDAVVALAAGKTISLSRAVSMMASTARTQGRVDEKLKYASLQQAARALCDAAWLGGVVLRGSRTEGGEVKQIPDDYFEIPRCLAHAPDSLERDYEAGIWSSSRSDRMRFSISDDDVALGGSEVLEGPRFDVEVDFAPLSKWLDGRILAARGEEARRQRSHRLFDHPFWSIETTLCWIALRNPGHLKTRRDETNASLQRVWLEADSQPEVRLLSKLQADKLQAVNGDEPVPKSDWEDCVPTSGCLAPKTLPLRLARDDVLRSFPVRRGSQRDFRNDRETTIERIARRMRRTRKWISCAEIADRMSDSSSRPRGKRTRERILCLLDQDFAIGKFHLNGRSQLRLLRPDTSAVRLSYKPIERKEVATPLIVSVSHYLENCWLPNEVCRRWFQEQNLVWPAHFDRLPFVKGILEGRSSVDGSAGGIPRRSVGRPSQHVLYLREYERRRDANELVGDFKQLAISIEKWGEADSSIKYQISYKQIQKIVRAKYPNWRDHIS